MAMAAKKPSNVNPLGPALAPANHAKPENLLVRRMRAANFLADYASGMSLAAVARKYNVHPDTVKSELRWAQNQGFFEKAEDAILHRLVPLAIDVYENALRKHLETGDYDAAEKLLKGMRLFSSGSASQGMPKPSQEVGAGDYDELTWERFTARRAERIKATLTEHDASAPAEGATHSGDAGGAGESAAIDAEILGEGVGEASASGSNPEGDAGTDRADGASGGVTNEL